MTPPEHVHDAAHPQFPQPVELPLEERDSTMDLRTQLLRFILTGGLSAIVDFGLLLILTHVGLHDTPAKACSFIAGTTTAYLINRRWTFRAAPSRRRFLAVVVLYAVTFALQVGLYSLLFHLLQGHLADTVVRLACFVVAQGVATTVNFIVQRAVIFRIADDAGRVGGGAR